MFFAPTFRQKQITTGDEPHYLLITQSLIFDHDLDLKNNYDQRDYLKFHPQDLPDRHTVLVRGHEFPVAGIGFPMLLMPFYLVGPRIAVMVLFNLVAALLAVNLFLAAFEITKRKLLSFFLALIFISTLPLSIYAFQIYPELIVGLIILYAFRKKFSPLAILGIAFLPWLHAKFYLVSLFFLGYYLWKKKFIPALGILVSLVGLAIYFKFLYGSFLTTAQVSEAGVWPSYSGILGLFLDRQFGLIAWNWWYLLVPFGLILWFKLAKTKLEKENWYLWLGLFLVLFLPHALFKYWTGGWSPAARYLVPIIPLFIYPIAFLYQKFHGRIFNFLSDFLVTISLALSAIALSVPAILFSSPQTGTQNQLLVKIGLPEILPSFIRLNHTDWWLIIIWFAGFILAIIIFAYKIDPKFFSRFLKLALVLWLIVAILAFFNLSLAGKTALSTPINWTRALVLNNWSYQAEDLARLAGEVKPDSKAQGGQYLTTTPTQAKNIYFIFGPLATLIPGEYQATFRLKTDKTELGHLADIEVATKQGANKPAMKKINGADFVKTNEFQDFTLNFSTSGSRSFEFRVYYLVGDLGVDDIKIKVQKRNWQELFRMVPEKLINKFSKK